MANSPDNLKEIAPIISENKHGCPNDRDYAGFTYLKEEGRFKKVGSELDLTLPREYWNYAEPNMVVRFAFLL